MNEDQIEELATKIADRLMRISGTNKQATLMTPSYDNGKSVAGSYNRAEFIREIASAIRQNLTPA